MYEQIRKSFLNDGIFLKESWLHSIFDSGQNTKEKVFTQLINTDISESCEQCPLPDFINVKSIKYEGKQVFLQINEVIDISLPFEKRTALERSAKGTFKIFLTDGVTNYFAISKTPITSFHTGVTPGAKIYIKPPIEGKFGIIFLHEKNIKFCNGCSQQVIENRKQKYSNSNQPKTTTTKTPAPNVAKVPNKPRTTQVPPNNNQQKNSQYLSDSNDDSDLIELLDQQEQVQNQSHAPQVFSQTQHDIEISDVESDTEIASSIPNNLVNRSNSLYKMNKSTPNKSNQNGGKDYMFLSDDSDSSSSVTIEYYPSHESRNHAINQQSFFDESDNFDESDYCSDSRQSLESESYGYD